MADKNIPVTLANIRAIHKTRHAEITTRLAEFSAVKAEWSDRRLFEELVFCIFTAGASARMGLNSVVAVRAVLDAAPHEELTQILLGKHRYPNARAGYICATRDFLTQDCGLRLGEKLENFDDVLARRDWLARERGIKGIGYKEASHFLRNVGYRGYGILDKHILRALAELGIIASPEPPTTRSRYLATEELFKQFARRIGIDFDELDLVLWSMKTGEILK